jgi:hypothetical protein
VPVEPKIASPSSRGPAIRERPDDFEQVATDQQLVVLEIAKPDIIVAISLGKKGIQVDQSNGDDGVMDVLVRLVLGAWEHTQLGGGHGISSYVCSFAKGT